MVNIQLIKRSKLHLFVSLIFLYFSISLYARSADEIYNWKYYQLAKNAINSHYYDLSYTRPLDIQKYCPNYPELDRESKILFWIAFLKELAYIESQNDPNTIYQEKFIDKDGFYVYSVGLFQLSLESANGNYNCNIKKYEDLKDPKINIDCTINIFDKLIQEDNVIRGYKIIAEEDVWEGLSKYWGSLRDIQKVKKIQKKLSNMDFCKQNLDFAFRR